MKPGDYILVIASSARMLTQLAVQSGYKVLAIDCFADIDMRDAAFDCCQVASLALLNIERAVTGFIDQYAVEYAITGSGFERHTESLAFLHQQLTLFSNSQACYLALQNKVEFFQNLDDFNIPYPETVFSPPLHTNGWLSKPFLHEGGQGISYCSIEEIDIGTAYYQRYIDGQSASVLFLADGQQAKLIGYNQQWSSNESFIFAGVINNFQLTSVQQIFIQGWLEKLVPLYGLIGLNCLDFMVKGERCYLLEINPRPSASMQLYPPEILSAHFDAFQGKLTEQAVKHVNYMAYQIIYANTPVKIPYNVPWTKCCVDIPGSGVLIDKDHPICSIIAHGKDPGSVFKQLKNKQNFIKNQLKLRY